MIHIPGHTPGSIALLERNQRFLIGGDSVQPGPIYMFGSARDMPTYIQSMEKLNAMRRLFDTVYASHGEPDVNPSIIPALAEGARQVLAGNVQGTELDRGNANHGKCKLYSTGGVQFFF